MYVLLNIPAMLESVGTLGQLIIRPICTVKKEYYDCYQRRFNFRAPISEKQSRFKEYRKSERTRISIRERGRSKDTLQ